MISIYSSFFNVEKAGFAWRETLENWQRFLAGRGEIVIAVNTSEDDSPRLIREWAEEWKKRNATRNVPVQVIDAAIPYDDPEFDGKLKALALSHCTQPYATLLDCDEVIIPSQRLLWDRLALELGGNPNLDAFMVPVVDLFGDEKSYKGIGAKWYLHKNHGSLTRGVVKWARREDGSIDIAKSDTCELIYKDTGELARSAPLMASIPHFLLIMRLRSGEVPFVYHTGYLSKEQRVKQDAFWEPVWRNRDKSEVKTAKSAEELDKIQSWPHGLPTWRVM